MFSPALARSSLMALWSLAGRMNSFYLSSKGSAKTWGHAAGNPVEYVENSKAAEARGPP